MNYELVLGMKVKSCINPPRWGAMIDLDFPRIYVWDCNDIKGLNVTKWRSRTKWTYSLKKRGMTIQLGENAAWVSAYNVRGSTKNCNLDLLLYTWLLSLTERKNIKINLEIFLYIWLRFSWNIIWRYVKFNIITIII